MKFSVSSSDLLKQLQVAGGAISSNPVLPILEYFLFTISDNKLTIAASDLETSITTELEVLSDGDGSVAVPAKTLVDTLKLMPSQPITFVVNDNYSIEVIASNGKYSPSGEDGSDFPSIPSIEDAASITMPAATLSQGINKTLFATSSDDMRLAMTGVYLQIEENAVTFVATDAHKLVRYRFSDVQSDIATAFILPKKALNLIKNALPAAGDVQISFNKSNAFFSFANVRLVCRLIDARYPDYNAVIPVDNPSHFVVNRADFFSTLKRISIYANKTTNQVVLNISDKSLTISAQDLDFSNEATEQLPCTFDGEQMTIGFNAKFLAEMVNVLEGEEIKMELSTPTRAGILRPMEAIAGEDILMLVMPVMLSN